MQVHSVGEAESFRKPTPWQTYFSPFFNTVCYHMLRKYVLQCRTDTEQYINYNSGLFPERFRDLSRLTSPQFTKTAKPIALLSL
jgi:hypothetical protein